MITYKKILENPQALSCLTGMSVPEFNKFYAEFELVHQTRLAALQYTRRAHLKRRRAAGAGRKYKYALCDRLLMTLFWLRAHTTYNVLGCLYDLNKTTVEENLKSILQTLELMPGFRFEEPQPDVPKLCSLQEVIDTFPDIRLVMRSEESPGEPPQSADAPG